MRRSKFKEVALTVNYWTEEDKQKVLALWTEGKSATQIAMEFSGKSRNSIIGLVHRMKAPRRERPPQTGFKVKREKPQQKKKTAFFITRVASQKFKVPPTPVAPPLSVVSGDGFSLRQLRDTQCRDVIGYRDGNLSDPIYCGAEKYQNTSYCEYHKSIYMYPPKSRL